MYMYVCATGNRYHSHSIYTIVACRKLRQTMSDLQDRFLLSDVDPRRAWAVRGVTVVCL